ncbi:hypothetical protein [Actinobacillus equuli]|uniref:hypothetical protein n=1 Tax=Actinobacillus equuli TaxID=718 RepID=UPI002441BDEA|nr:hypothetical protein [Actinobacillus equuli]WGE79428.1 hypothetical protein NYR83_00350 [Actinobacillus equuli subsp. equuli]
MAINLFMAAADTANYINTKLKKNDYTALDVIFLATKGVFPAFNYLRYVGSANNKFHRNLYKINGLKGLYEDLLQLDTDEIANYLVNNRSIVTDEDCENFEFSLVKYFMTKDYEDPRYELLFDTRLVLTDVDPDPDYDGLYSASLYSLSTEFSKLDRNGVFNGIIISPFIKPIAELHLPVTSILQNELERFFYFRGDSSQEYFDDFTVYLFDSVLISVDMPLQICYEIYDEHIEIFNEENINEIFLFYRPHIDKYIERLKNKRCSNDSSISSTDTQQIADLQSQLENLKKPDTQAVENGGNVDIREYVGEIPPSTDRDKLRGFIELIAHDDFIENGKLISYSRIHTKLTSKYRNKSIPSKNTIGKYINEVQ